MIYEKFEYLWPPRPTGNRAVAPMMLNFYEKRGWVGQIKRNGTCNVIAVSPDGQIIAMNRHKEVHRAWTPDPKKMTAFSELGQRGWFVFVAELLHSKVPGLRDINYIFDVLVAEGKYLVGTTFMERQTILDGLFPETREETSTHRVIDDHTWVAKLIRDNFKQTFDGLSAPEDEGLVLKNPNGILELCSRDTTNTGWQVKVRRPHKNFNF